MWFDLQDASAGFELSLAALRQTLGAGRHRFLRAARHVVGLRPRRQHFPRRHRCPNMRLKAPVSTARQPRPADRRRANIFPSAPTASPSPATHTTSGAALLANDMHLTPQRVPHIWYRAVLAWSDADGTAHRLVGVTLPGTPRARGRAATAASPGATPTPTLTRWTSSTVETETTADLVLRHSLKRLHRDGRSASDHHQGEGRRARAPSPPAGPSGGRFSPARPRAGIYALRWTAHDPATTNLRGPRAGDRGHREPRPWPSPIASGHAQPESCRRRRTPATIAWTHHRKNSPPHRLRRALPCLVGLRRPQVGRLARTRRKFPLSSIRSEGLCSGPPTSASSAARPTPGLGDSAATMTAHAAAKSATTSARSSLHGEKSHRPRPPRHRARRPRASSSNAGSSSSSPC